uniref:Uncharacterized protein n=1 Tax=Rhizophora mucronata TaxID=61149 RepID=A0A2P2PCI1_RHIMU
MQPFCSICNKKSKRVKRKEKKKNGIGCSYKRSSKGVTGCL